MRRLDVTDVTQAQRVVSINRKTSEKKKKLTIGENETTQLRAMSSKIHRLITTLIKFILLKIKLIYWCLRNFNPENKFKSEIITS